MTRQQKLNWFSLVAAAGCFACSAFAYSQELFAYAVAMAFFCGSNLSTAVMSWAREADNKERAR